MPGCATLCGRCPRQRIPASLEACLFRRLQILDDARTDADLGVPPSNHFEKLKGALGGWHSIRVNEHSAHFFLRRYLEARASATSSKVWPIACSFASRFVNCCQRRMATST